ncbi:hypothetical protein HPY31_28505 [Brevibacillus sp. HB1.3]|uniref:hypothetical protein n=1 Tax=Brevibacillus sp. HB1.3 TaxID=2738842 RepID=UPI001554A968|nr:hypothetical protein [Brevibacillus sp. HB1.3]NQF17810.1 hypothetical protein [Brevibacillus sp. HB1.3]
MTVKVNLKGEHQKTVKIFKQGSPKMKRISKVFGIGATLFSLYANHIFKSNPHDWLDIIGHYDLLLLCVALVLSLANFYIKATLWFIDVYIGNMGKIKILMTIVGILVPFGILIHSLVTKHALYVIPLIVVITVHFYTQYKSKKPSLGKVIAN